MMFEIRVLTCSYFEGTNWFYDLSDPFWRIYLHSHPGEWMSMGGRGLRSDPSHLTVISPYTKVKAMGGSKPYHFFIHFIVGYPFDLVNGKVFQFAPGEGLLDALIAMRGRIRNGESTDVGDSLVCMRACAEALSRIPRTEWGIADSANKKVSRVDSHMEEHIDQSLSNSELASLVCMAPNAFVRFFKSATGCSPQRYFTRKKVKRACFLLQYRDHSIEAVADLLGYCDRYYFSRVFKRVTGSAPAEFRRTARASGQTTSLL